MGKIKEIIMDADTAYERGKQYGKAATPEIDIAIDYYKKKFEQKYEWSKVVEFADKFCQETKKFDGEIMEELQGIADGAGRDVREIMAVNARYEISQFNWQQECTTGVFLDGVDGYDYIFKNCDLGRAVEKHLVALRISKPNGYKAFGIAEAGQLIRDGFNNMGIGLVNSALRSNKDYAGIAVPGTVVRKKVWESSSFEQACDVQRHLFRTVSTNMLLAGKGGQALDFECHPNGEFEVKAINNMIGTGNRFTMEPTLNRAIDPNIDRGLQVKKLMMEQKDNITPNTLMNILRNHEGYPESICRHADEIGHSTVYSIIMNLNELKCYFCLGNPCKTEYTEYTI